MHDFTRRNDNDPATGKPGTLAEVDLGRPRLEKGIRPSQPSQQITPNQHRRAWCEGHVADDVVLFLVDLVLLQTRVRIAHHISGTPDRLEPIRIIGVEELRPRHRRLRPLGFPQERCQRIRPGRRIAVQQPDVHDVSIGLLHDVEDSLDLVRAFVTIAATRDQIGGANVRRLGFNGFERSGCPVGVSDEQRDHDRSGGIGHERDIVEGEGLGGNLPLISGLVQGRLMRITLLSGGVGGARMALGFASVPGVSLTTVVNVGDDASTYGVDVSPDLDTVVYTLARRNGEAGWGVKGDSFAVMAALNEFGVDTTFRVGDVDLATSLFRTLRLAEGAQLSQVTAAIAQRFGVPAQVLPASDDRISTELQVRNDGWISFREYFVERGHQDEVLDIRFTGSSVATPAPGVVEAIETADLVVIAPSNPVLSIWPILAVSGIAQALSQRDRVVAVSPLIGGRALRGPADQIMDQLGLPAGSAGVVAAYDGLLTDLFVDTRDAADRGALQGIRVHVAPLRIPEVDAARALAAAVIELIA